MSSVLIRRSKEGQRMVNCCQCVMLILGVKIRSKFPRMKYILSVSLKSWGDKIRNFLGEVFGWDA